MIGLSKYSIIFNKNGKNFIFNSRTNSFYLVSDDLYNILSNAEIKNFEESLPTEIFEELKRKKIIVPESEDEKYFNFLKLGYLKNAFSNDVFGLTILPTLSCNLQCPYCFETYKRSIKMSEHTIEKIVQFILKRSINKNYAITWFGGEPLLGIDTIEKILLSIAENKEYKLANHSIITNGTLLNSKAIEVFKKFPLDYIQITLDGNKITHDSKRFFASGEGTFDIIMNNVSSYLENSPKASLSFRINIDNDNKNEYAEIFEFIKKKFKGYNIQIYAGILRANPGCESETFFTSKDHVDFSRMLWRNQMENIYPHKCSKGCCATSISQYVVGPEGELYLCWEHVGQKGKIIGDLTGQLSESNSLYEKFKLDGHCFNDSRCHECGLLPLCSGGCADKRVQNTHEGKNHELCCIYNDKDGQGLTDLLYEYYILTSGNKNR